MDLSHAMPGKALAKLPSSAAQLQTLSSELKQVQPQLAGAREKSDTLAAEAASGVQHHVALSVVGTDRLQASGYFRAKLAQENLIAASGVPYTIVRATQFFEFMDGIARASTDGQVVRLPPALMQPMSADDVAAAVADYALGRPLNRVVEIAGPDALGIDESVRRFLIATGDARRVVTDTGGRRTERWFIRSEILLAGRRFAADINLTDRRHMLFPMLLGRSALHGRFAVDPARAYTQPRLPLAATDRP